jgi:hypothetical protein
LTSIDAGAGLPASEFTLAVILSLLSSQNDGTELHDHCATLSDSVQSL